MGNLYSSNKHKLPIISIVATKSGTGKTTLIEKLIRIFKSRGYIVGVLKHDAHKFDIDKEGKDSWKFAQAGADNVIISSSEKIAMVKRTKEQKNIEEIIDYFKEVDILLIEGFKNNNYSKIEVHRKGSDDELLCEDINFNKDTFLAIATDEKLNVDIPNLDLNDEISVANFIEENIIKSAYKDYTLYAERSLKEGSLMDKTVACKVSKIQGDNRFLVDELLVCEFALTIFLNGIKIKTLLCTPENMQELAVGFLRTEELISEFSEIVSVKISEDKGILEVETCSKCEENKSDVLQTSNTYKKIDNIYFDSFKDTKCKAVNSDITLQVDKIYSFMKETLNYSEVFKNTGGVHCIALCDKENVLFMCEDVARHNAMDKVIGKALMQNISLKDKVIILSGRVSLEMILKAAKMEIPIVVSKSAPTTLSVELAEKLNITLVGFVRGEKMNIYTNENRISDFEEKY